MMPMVMMVMPPPPMMMVMMVVLCELDLRAIAFVICRLLSGRCFCCVSRLKQGQRIRDRLEQVRITAHFHNIRGGGRLNGRSRRRADGSERRQCPDDASNFFVHDHSTFPS